jgi:UDP-N-acetylmuramoyl-L-alanyl-D-glutamate--2,6-diaminopimelate ligase
MINDAVKWVRKINKTPTDDARIANVDSLFIVTVQNVQFLASAVQNGCTHILADLSLKETIAAMNFQQCNIMFCDNIFTNAHGSHKDISQNNLPFVLNAVYPNMPSNIMAITGTNGKTSVASFVKQIFGAVRGNGASIGTLGVEIFGENEAINTGLTTPSLCDNYKFLADLKAKGVDNVIVEAASHGLVQGRLAGLNISVAGFTNFTQDHLDYHKNMDEYFNAKKMLFSHYLASNAWAIINADIEKYEELTEICKEKNLQMLDYGTKENKVKLIKSTYKNGLREIEIMINEQLFSFTTNVVADFQVNNMLCAICFALACGINIEQIIDIMPKLQAPNGRMDRVIFNNKPTNIYIDYAHTPDALQRAIETLQDICTGRLIVVFGCGGDRDKTKRPIMGKIAASSAHLVIVTDDNPRTEDPVIIRTDIISGIKEAKKAAMDKMRSSADKIATLMHLQAENVIGNVVEITTDRKDAIGYAISQMQPEDVLLIAGKGHEDYQIRGTQKYPFNEKQIVCEFLTQNKQS